MGQFWRWLPRCHQWFPAWVHLWNQWRVLVLWNRWRLVVHHHHHHHYHPHHRHHLMSGPSPLSWRLHRWLGLQLMGQFVAVLLGSNSIRGRDRVVDQLRCQLSRTSCDLGMFQRGLKRDIWRHIPTKMFGYVRSIQRNLIEQEGKWQLLQSVANSCFSCALSTHCSAYLSGRKFWEIVGTLGTALLPFWHWGILKKADSDKSGFWIMAQVVSMMSQLLSSQCCCEHYTFSHAPSSKFNIETRMWNLHDWLRMKIMASAKPAANSWLFSCVSVFDWH